MKTEPFVISVVLLTSLFISQTALATTTYSASDVAAHNTTSDCWVIMNSKVYDITRYLPTHDRSYYDINSWCGKDMTSDFETKDGTGIDHRSSSYSLLNSYYIGDLSASGTTTATTTPSTSNSSVDAKTVSPKSSYNFWLPFLGTLIVFGLTLAIKLPKPKFHFTWNTVLGLSLIPSAIFGFYFVLQSSTPTLLYWHVEGSIVFGTVVLLHLIMRFKIYLAQGRAPKS